jgi:hypothetical protein
VPPGVATRPGREPGPRSGFGEHELVPLAEVRSVLAAQVERNDQQQRPRPPVHRVDQQWLVVADRVRDEPDDEPEKCQGSSSGRFCTIRVATPGQARIRT